jgi:REP element-mobilizing transposase RayT
MPQSLSFVVVHIIFSTKDRRPFLKNDFQSNAHAYLASVARDFGCECFRVGGMSDHVHLAISLSRTVTIAKLVETLKTSSAKWLKAETSCSAAFAWQRGYGVFSVSPRQLPKLVEYIDRQEEHHGKKTFKEEFREFCDRYGVKYDERYVWD